MEGVLRIISSFAAKDGSFIKEPDGDIREVLGYAVCVYSNQPTSESFIVPITASGLELWSVNNSEVLETIPVEDQNIESLDTPVEGLGFSRRLTNALYKAGFNTKGEILSGDLSQMKYIRGFGRTCQQELRRWIAANEFKMAK